MKKSWKRILAVAVILALALCVLSGCSDDSKAKIDEAVKNATETLTKEKDEALAAAQTAADEALKSAQDAADAVKAELEGQVADLTEKLTAAEESAKTAAEAALKEKDEAVAAVKAELEGQVAELTEKLTAAEESAKTAAEAALKEKDEAVAAAQTAADEALKSAQDAADAAKAELEGKVADLTKELEDVKAAATEGADAAAKAATDAAEAAKAELEGQVKDLTDKLAAADAAKAELEGQVKDLTDKQAAADAAKAELETKVADLEKQIADAAEAAKEEVTEVAAAVEEKAEEVAEEAAAEETPAEETPVEEPAAEEAAVMSHEEYINAELDSPVCVETYVQATQSWWDNKITVYAQSEDGAYFIYNMTCTEEDAANLVAGAKIRVNGFKSEWAGETEIIDATFELIEGDPFIAEPADVTDALGGDSLILHQNEKVLIKGLTVAAQDDGEAINFKNATEKTDDIYIRLTKDDMTYNFCLEFYLTGSDTDVYKAAQELKVGDVIDIEGFLYWYNEPNTHITAITKAE